MTDERKAEIRKQIEDLVFDIVLYATPYVQFPIGTLGAFPKSY